MIALALLEKGEDIFCRLFFPDRYFALMNESVFYTSLAAGCADLNDRLPFDA